MKSSLLRLLPWRKRPELAVTAVPAGSMSQPALLVLGHSHMIALQGARDLARDAGGADTPELRFVQLLDADISPNVHFNGTAMVLVPALQARLSQEIAALGAVPSCIFDCVSGNEYHFMGLVNHPRKFDFVLPWAPDLPLAEEAEIVPYVLVRASLKASMEYALTVLTCLRQATSVPIWHIQSPPPVSSNDEIAAHPIQFADAITEHGVAPPFFRLKLWQLQSDIIREACEAVGINFLLAPAAGMDADGFVHLDGWHGDPTHANYWYGRLVLEQMFAIASAKPATMDLS
jgi:hypothetical protein